MYIYIYIYIYILYIYIYIYIHTHRVVNIGCQSIVDTVLPILFQYRSRYRQYFPAQVSHAVSAILYLDKKSNIYLILFY